jgi:UDP-N-acetylmuramoyl-tripeptide--D-alanyl-D-alanine ligase
MSIERLYGYYLSNPRVQTDTRKIQPGEIFFALKGPNFNGNTFALQALEQGAVLAVIDEHIDSTDPRLFKVDDVLETLQALALHHRKQFDIPFIAITGSNGKTTTKELIHAVISTTFKTYTTKGNLNNHIGIPLTILDIKSDAQMAVVEMGANHQKEIEGYCKIALPTHGIITNCGKAHLEGFGGVEGVRKGKGELYDYLRASGGTGFVMWDYDYLREMSKGIPQIITYGTTDASLTGSAVATDPFLHVKIDGETEGDIQSMLVGDYNLPNILVAVAVGKYFEIPYLSIKKAIENYSPTNSRSQLIRRAGNEIILDAYNANPTSMRAAIENFARHKASNKWILIGGMMELGENSVAEHQDIVDLLKTFNWGNVVLVGGDFQYTKHPYTFLTDSAAAAEWIKKEQPQKAAILIKGSRSMKMEKVMESIGL